MHSFDKRRPLGGLDMDSEARSLTSLDYLYGLNIRNAVTATGTGGTLTNIQGNSEITGYTMPYTGGTSLPSGENICIGAFEDDKNKTIVYFVWNSNGEHCILRYFSDLIDPSNEWGVIEQVIGYDFGWSSETRITSASVVYGTEDDLLYWIDPKPRMINMTKANVCRKYKTWEVVLPAGYAGTAFFFQVVVSNFATGSPIASIDVNVAGGLSIADILESVSSQINSGLSAYLTSEVCDCTITITEDAINAYNIVFTSGAFFVIPLNWYGTSLIDRYFDRCKYPETVNPIPSYGVDTSYGFNYVDDTAFQFRLRYIYENFEYSTSGVISQVPIDNVNRAGEAIESYNYIRINFNDTALLLAQTLVILKKVEVWVLQVDGVSWKRVVVLSPCEFLDYADSAVLARYDFYNNIQGETIDAATASKLFDPIPLESGAEIFAKNRLIDGDILEGYNPPDCIDAAYQMEFVENPQAQGYTVTVNLAIFNFRLDNTDTVPATPTGTPFHFVKTQPNEEKTRGGIFWKPDLFTDPATPYPVYGGAFVAGGTVYITDTPPGAANTPIQAAFSREQILPEAGFLVYLAGTDYKAFSKQINIGSLDQNSDSSISLISSNAADKIKDYYLTTDVELRSIANILNVPNGKYVLRVASPWCSFGDKLSKGELYDVDNGRQYQNTSCPIWGVYNEQQAAFFPVCEIPFEVSGADVYIGEVYVKDNINYLSGDGYTLTTTGYVRDNEGQIDVLSMKEGVSVEKAYVEQMGNRTATLIPMGEDYTDHNGYYCVSSGQNATDRTVAVYQINPVTTTATEIHAQGDVQYITLAGQSAALTQMNNETIPAAYIGSANWFECIIPVTYDLARATFSTFIEGRVIDSSGNPVLNSLVVYESGRFVFTNSLGEYSILAWADMREYTFTGSYTTNQNRRIVDSLIITAPLFSEANYPSGQTIAVSLTPWIPNYTPDNTYDAGDLTIDITNNEEEKARKRGGNYFVGIRYYDAAGRLCTVSKAMEIYVPFITEDLGNFPAIKDFSDNNYAAGTYRYGLPSIKWFISSRPPEWASTYQWMLTKNTIYGRYLQWVADSVKYLVRTAQGDDDEVVTTYANGDYTALKIGIGNIVNYSSLNPESQISYSFEEGDRVRLIATRYIEYYEGLFDFEVASFDTDSLSLIVKVPTMTFEVQSGMFFEVYNPKRLLDNEQQIYYECGEVYKCTSPNNPNNEHSVTSALFTSGDTYWHGRSIPVSDDENNFGATYNLMVESASISDFYSSTITDDGRIGIVDENFRQEHNPVLMRFSSQFLAVNNGVNGLSTIETENYLELDRATVAIRALVFTNNTLVIVGANRETSQYLGQTTLQQATTVQSGIVALSNSFFGAPYVHSRMLGTDQKQSVVAYNGQIFGMANYIGSVWRYQGDGETCISDVNMVTYFQQLSQGGIKGARGVYDRYHEEYILTIDRTYTYRSAVSIIEPISGGYRILVYMNDDVATPEVGDAIEVIYVQDGERIELEGTVYSVTFNEETNEYDVVIDVQTDKGEIVADLVIVVFSLPETIAWFNGTDNIKGNRWVSFRSYTPEAYGVLRSGIYSFREGRLWKHDTNQNFNNFFGEQYKSAFTPVFNENPDWMKVWNSNTLMSLQDDGGNDWSATSITNSNGQASRLKKGSWTKKGEYWYAPFKRNLNDLTVAEAVRISNGSQLRSTSLTCAFENDYVGSWRLWGVDANWTPSERTTK